LSVNIMQFACIVPKSHAVSNTILLKGLLLPLYPEK
jgi:hypothetical protein